MSMRFGFERYCGVLHAIDHVLLPAGYELAHSSIKSQWQFCLSISIMMISDIQFVKHSINCIPEESASWPWVVKSGVIEVCIVFRTVMTYANIISLDVAIGLIPLEGG